MKNMKKVLAGLLLVAVLCGVTACGDNNDTNHKENTTTTEDRKEDNRDTNKEDGLIEDTGEDIKDGVEDLGDDIRNGMDDMEDSIENNGNNAVNDSNAGENRNE